MPDVADRGRIRLGLWVAIATAVILIVSVLIAVVAGYYFYQKTRKPGVVQIPGQVNTAGGAASPGLRANAPDWVPVYPGATDLRHGIALNSPEGVVGSFFFTTSDPVAKVAKFYEGRMQAAGFKVNWLGEYAEGMPSAILLIEHEDGKRNLTVNLQSRDSGAEAQVQFGVKK